jgi:hypothetical protein
MDNGKNGVWHRWKKKEPETEDDNGLNQKLECEQIINEENNTFMLKRISEIETGNNGSFGKGNYKL